MNINVFVFSFFRHFNKSTNSFNFSYKQNVTEYNVERVQCTIDNQFSLLGRSCVVVVADCSGGC